MKRPARILVLTGTRAEYGLLHPLLVRLAANPAFDLRLLATGTHLSPQHGMTVREIEADGFRVDERAEILISADSESGVAKSMGLAVILFTEAFVRQAPEALVLLGDRFEVLAAAVAASALRIPIVHLEGGHLTTGAIDDAMRHAVTKLAHLHFTGAEVYARRLRQMGEAPDRVHAVGSPGLDNILTVERWPRERLAADIDFAFRSPCVMATFHPATLEQGLTPGEQVDTLLDALDALPEVSVLFTMPNADAGGREVGERILAFAAAHADRCRVVTSLGRVRYVSALALVDAVVGNSSSGLIEAPSFGIGTVNIGTRQDGRLRAASIVDCPLDSAEIVTAIRRVLTPEFREGPARAGNPFGDGHAAERIIAILEATDFARLLEKRFIDQ
ncbi:MAG: UDP-N-acetylglucosamine 2-epimerase [Siculibacillus sp.]|nr:UDP-N-acetylglucosamine 2-epimerase [Siculibacillus sp.]